MLPARSCEGCEVSNGMHFAAAMSNTSPIAHACNMQSRQLNTKMEKLPEVMHRMQPLTLITCALSDRH